MATHGGVERIRPLNYPDVAKPYEVNGTLALDVAIGRNGQLMEARLNRSSGNKRLYDAAIRIEKLAAPFDLLPTEIARHTGGLTYHSNRAFR